jgi:Phage tail assembly chaperone proteins, E, or 41 or 14
MPDDILPLSKPITAHGGQLSALTFREPGGNDLIDCGLPFSLVVGKKGVVVEINTAAMGEWIATLAGIPPSAMKQLSFGDMAAAMAKVTGFFGVVIPLISGMITLPSPNGGATSPT